MVAPGVDTMGAAYERDYGRWECEPGGETVCLRLHPDVIRRYMQEEAYQFDLETKYATKDDTLVHAMFLLAEEMQSAFPNGKLYAEGLSLMIVGWLSRHHASKQAQAYPQARVLSTSQQARVRELVDASLDCDLSVELMAAEVGISPFHFSRLFRATFGMPPYRYVLQTRIARAAYLLRAERQRTVADIALEVGFSSQAHLTHAFKCHTGQTPGTMAQPRDIRKNASSMSQEILNHHDARRTAWASWIASALEYYDFFLYATAAALVLGPLYFPASEPGVTTLASLASVGAGYVTRPVGAVFLGLLGDLFGRRFVLSLSLVLMGAATFLIGVLPTYQEIGIAAPVALVILRLIQGLAVSGEHAGASALALEMAATRRRGLYASFSLSGTQAGLILASVVFLLLSAVLSERRSDGLGVAHPLFVQRGRRCRGPLGQVPPARKPRFPFGSIAPGRLAQPDARIVDAAPPRRLTRCSCGGRFRLSAVSSACFHCPGRSTTFIFRGRPCLPSNCRAPRSACL